MIVQKQKISTPAQSIEKVENSMLELYDTDIDSFYTCLFSIECAKKKSFVNVYIYDVSIVWRLDT